MAFLKSAEDHGYRLLVTQTLRTWEEQDQLYAQGRTAPGPIVTHARGGESWHNFGRAIDVCFLNDRGGVAYDGPWELLGHLAEDVGMEWGGSWEHNPDRDHFQFTAGMTLAQARAEFLAEGKESST